MVKYPSFKRLAEGNLVALRMQHAKLAQAPGLADRIALNAGALGSQFRV